MSTTKPFEVAVVSFPQRCLDPAGGGKIAWWPPLMLRYVGSRGNLSALGRGALWCERVFYVLLRSMLFGSTVNIAALEL